MGQVEKIRTPLSIREIKPILSAAFEHATGRSIGKAMPYLLAMIALENRSGEAIYNHNWGNVIVTSEHDNYFKHPSIPLNFKSLDSHYNGAAHFIKTLLSKTNSRIIEAARNDDFDGFFQSIHDRHPTTHKAYNLVTESSLRTSLRNTYSALVNQFKGSPNVQVKMNVKKKNNDIGGPLLVAILLGGGLYFGRNKIKNALSN